MQSPIAFELDDIPLEIEVIASPEARAELAAALRRMHSRWGVPSTVRVDEGPAVTPDQMRRVCEALRIPLACNDEPDEAA